LQARARAQARPAPAKDILECCQCRLVDLDLRKPRENTEPAFFPEQPHQQRPAILQVGVLFGIVVDGDLEDRAVGSARVRLPAPVLVEEARLESVFGETGAYELRNIPAVETVAGIELGRQLRDVVEAVRVELEPAGVLPKATHDAGS